MDEKNKDLKEKLLQNAKNRSLKNGREFSITIDDFNIPKKCECCGFSMSEKNNPPQDSKIFHAYPSLDRVDNEKGYVRGNVFVICSHCNFIKGKWSLKELENIVRYMRRHIDFNEFD